MSTPTPFADLAAEYAATIEKKDRSLNEALTDLILAHAENRVLTERVETYKSLAQRRLIDFRALQKENRELRDLFHGPGV